MMPPTLKGDNIQATRRPLGSSKLTEPWSHTQKEKRKMNKRIVVWERRHSRLGHAWTRNHKAVTPTPEESRLPSLLSAFSPFKVYVV
jgi:hypothetical protein